MQTHVLESSLWAASEFVGAWKRGCEEGKVGQGEESGTGMKQDRGLD